MDNELYNDLNVFVLVRDYLKKDSQKCIRNISACNECGLCWMSEDEIFYLLEYFNA